MKKSHIVMLADFLLVIPLTLFLCMRLPGRGYYITSTLVIVELLVPFLLAFESRRPQARELVVIAVLSALAVAARVVIPLPHFKAIFAVIMLSGDDNEFATNEQSALVQAAAMYFGKQMEE